MNITKRRQKLLRKTSGILFLNSLLCFVISIGLFANAAPVFAKEISLTDAVDKGKVEATAKGVGGYSSLSIDLKNRTNDNLDVDINGTYFNPPASSSSQRMGVAYVSGSEGDSIVNLGPKEEKNIKANAFCIDSTKGIPGYDEEYTFSGDVSDIEERPYLDDVLEWYKDHPDANHYDVQDAVWSVESDLEGENSHLSDGAKNILEQATGSEDPLKDKLELDEQKEDAKDKAEVALGTALSSLLASGAISTLNGGGMLDGAKSLWDLFSGTGKSTPKTPAPSGPPKPELIKNLSVDNYTEAILGLGEDNINFGDDIPVLDADGNPLKNPDGTIQTQPNTLKTVWKHSNTALGIFNDANGLYQNGYDGLQSVGLSTMMNLGANKVMDMLGGNYLGPLETITKLFTPKSCQDILPSNIAKQSIQALGDVTKALAESAGSGDWKPLNDYAQGVAEGKGGKMLQGWGVLGETAGEITNAIEEKGLVQTVKDFGSDIKQIYEQGTWKDVIKEGVQSIADEAKAGSSADKGIAELSEVTGHVVGTLESKGVVEGTKELAGQFADDVKVILKHGDADQIMQDVGDSAEKATGIIGKGVAEASSLAGEYYEQGGGVIGGLKQFGSDCKLIWKYLW